MSELNQEWSVINSDNENIKKNLQTLNTKFTAFEEILKSLETKIDKISLDNQTILKYLEENRDLYISAINSVGEKEDNNFNQLKPLIEENKFNFHDPNIMSRVTNSYWRNNFLTTPNLSFSVLNNSSFNNPAFKKN